MKTLLAFKYKLKQWVSPTYHWTSSIYPFVIIYSTLTLSNWKKSIIYLIAVENKTNQLTKETSPVWKEEQSWYIVTLHLFRSEIEHRGVWHEYIIIIMIVL